MVRKSEKTNWGPKYTGRFQRFLNRGSPDNPFGKIKAYHHGKLRHASEESGNYAQHRVGHTKQYGVGAGVHIGCA